MNQSSAEKSTAGLESARPIGSLLQLSVHQLAANSSFRMGLEFDDAEQQLSEQEFCEQEQEQEQKQKQEQEQEILEQKREQKQRLLQPQPLVLLPLLQFLQFVLQSLFASAK